MNENDSQEEITGFSDRLRDAFCAHQCGDLDSAEASYRSILDEMPQHLDANQLLGALLVQRNRPQESLTFLLAAVRGKTRAAQCFNNLAVAYSRLGRLEDSAKAYRSSLEIDPANFDTLRNLGRQLSNLKRFSEAVPFLSQAVVLRPEDSQIRVALGVALIRVGREEDAIAHFERVLETQPQHVVALKGIGQILLKDRQKNSKAILIWQRLVELEQKNAAFHNNLASVLKQAERYAEARSACDRALEILPDFFPALCNLGLILSIQEQFSESRGVLQRAVGVDQIRREVGSAEFGVQHPEYALLDEATWDEFAAVAYCQLAAISNLLGYAQEAQGLITTGLSIDANHVDCHMMQAFLHLQIGRFELGWPHYEWRKRGPSSPQIFDKPEWRGEFCPNKTVLLHVEQGLGDTIQFVRYAAQVKERVGTVLLLCQKSLVHLIRSYARLDRVIAEDETLPDFDYHIPLLSLPSVFNTCFDNVPRDVPYLGVPSELIAYWKNQLENLPGYRIGIAWQGNKGFAFDSLRRIHPEYFREIASIQGVRLISLQKGDALTQLREIDFEVVTFDELDEKSGAFMDTAALMNNLDLVISPCTATTHLAGALGRPIWLAKSFAAEWRWMSDDRAENPWYPTMRMFRQPKLGDWKTVFKRMTIEIQRKVINL